ncbi:RNA polymerase III-inhibiting protein maf1 [Orbilia oligospora]|uniref:RNA polymerase III-inhibiting protein maf1 n=1 Tax=Orbilia oligospora TaxID=2813651 RepID=A0A7C8JN44_ORBOL|nr:RNA polymerase III-inhibiting protein maf1 [Orbilia oligospora]
MRPHRCDNSRSSVVYRIPRASSRTTTFDNSRQHKYCPSARTDRNSQYSVSPIKSIRFPIESYGESHLFKKNYGRHEGIDAINLDLNFSTSDCCVFGGCDLYTTKATGSDKRLLRSITDSIETKFEADARLSASLSPPLDSTELFSRSSPFGPLDQTSSRKIYSYLLATLNASHPYHEFSSIVRPDHFSKERCLLTTMNRFNAALFNLGKTIPNLWETIDMEMDLKDCAIYVYEPDNLEDPYATEGLLWCMMYFFHNKHRKREECDDEDWNSDSERLWETPGSDSDEFVEHMEI